MSSDAGEDPRVLPSRGLRLGGRYELRRRIAVGGMGEVWMSRDLALDRSVATKVLRPELAGDDRFLDRLRAEARTSAPLAHPNIAALYDYGEEAGSGYLVMELVAGETLSDVLARERVVATDALLAILAQAARALHAAHVCGVVHRDVKPSNILVTPDGRVKITDFGISVVASATTTTPDGTVLGTAQYLAPEQALGRPATPAGDVYALGVIAYEALAGRRPFTGGSLAEVARAHVTDPVPDLPDVVPRPVRDVVLRMLEKDPERRPRSAASLARTLDRIAKEIELARPFDRTERPSAAPGRHAGLPHDPRTEHGRHRRGLLEVAEDEGRAPAGPPTRVRIRSDHGGVIEVVLPDAGSSDPGEGAPAGGEPGVDTVTWSAGTDPRQADPRSVAEAVSRASLAGEARPHRPAPLPPETRRDPAREIGGVPVPAPGLPTPPAVAPPVPRRHPTNAPRAQSRTTSERRTRVLPRVLTRVLPRRLDVPWLWIAVVVAVAFATALVLAAGTLERSVESAPGSVPSEVRAVAANWSPAPAGARDRASDDDPGHPRQIEDESW